MHAIPFVKQVSKHGYKICQSLIECYIKTNYAEIIRKPLATLVFNCEDGQYHCDRARTFT